MSYNFKDFDAQFPDEDACLMIVRTKIHGYTTDLRAVYKTFRGYFICIHDAKKKDTAYE